MRINRQNKQFDAVSSSDVAGARVRVGVVPLMLALPDRMAGSSRSARTRCSRCKSSKDA